MTKTKYYGADGFTIDYIGIYWLVRYYVELGITEFWYVNLNNSKYFKESTNIKTYNMYIKNVIIRKKARYLHRA